MKNVTNIFKIKNKPVDNIQNYLNNNGGPMVHVFA
jgi:hypothetical protein